MATQRRVLYLCTSRMKWILFYDLNVRRRTNRCLLEGDCASNAKPASCRTSHVLVFQNDLKWLTNERTNQKKSEPQLCTRLIQNLAVLSVCLPAMYLSHVYLHFCLLAACCLLLLLTLPRGRPPLAGNLLSASSKSKADGQHLGESDGSWCSYVFLNGDLECRFDPVFSYNQCIINRQLTYS